ncbi:Cytochrome P450 [Sergentomyia squamirostris]
MEVILFILLGLLGFLCWMDTRKPSGFPPGPVWLPVVGNFPQVLRLRRSLNHYHKIWQQLNQKYGSIVGLRLGRDRLIVISGWEAIREFYSRPEFDGRPDGFFFRVRSFDQRLGLVFTDGHPWEIQRRFCMTTLKQLGFGRCSMVDHIEREAAEMVKHLWSLNEKDGWIYNHNVFDIGVINVLWTLMAGRRYDLKDERLNTLMRLIHETFKIIDMSGGILNQFPQIRHILPTLSGYRPLVDAFKPLWDFLRETIDEIRQTASGESTSLIQAYVKELETCGKAKSTFSPEQLLALCLDMFQAGSETTSNTLGFALIYMLRYPQVASRVRKELDVAVGVESLPKLKHRSLLTYTEAVLCEVMRCCNVAPLAIVHRALETVHFRGFCIPKDTLALVSLYSLHHDDAVWQTPEEFRPERFLDRRNQLMNREGFLPFGSGKRRCMGENLAKSSLLVFFATFMYTFEMRLADDDSTKLPDLEGLDGITLSPKPYRIVLSKRN